MANPACAALGIKRELAGGGGWREIIGGRETGQSAHERQGRTVFKATRDASTACALPVCWDATREEQGSFGETWRRMQLASKG